MTAGSSAAGGGNRLAHQSSPYLLQHASNPVDWHPWGDEAFACALRRDKPVFLSIGYSTCHWCHVMERESFEDEATAALLNNHFVCVKVDREERPDVDETYMKAVQMMTGSGGWPLSVFLTPQGRPFYGGTYFPPTSMYGRPSFQQVLLAIAQAWRDKRRDLLESAKKVTDSLVKLEVAGSPKIAAAARTADVPQSAFAALSRSFDESHGGFGDAPKFPQPGTLAFLLAHGHRTGEEGVLRMVTQTLDAMAAGGIHDHLGGGFHRYATDRQWHVPHFEKMLYDQALLGQVYVQAFQSTGRERYASVARGIFDYVLRDLTDPGGGFYAAEDADSEGKEGTFYVWTQAEIESILPQRQAGLLCERYGITKKGSFENGTSILHLARRRAKAGDEPACASTEIEGELAGAREKLLQHRIARPRPGRDDKIIAGWNGLMISAMAYGGAVLGESRYVAAAEKAGRFVLDSLLVKGRLMRYFRGGRAVEKGFLDDYAYLIGGLVELYQATFDARWLREAADLADRMIDLFGDSRSGGYFLAGRDGERLIVSEKPSYDGAVPSGNSAAAMALLRLAKLTGEERYAAQAQRVLDAFSIPMVESPTALAAMATALTFAMGPSQEIVIAASQQQAQTDALLGEVRRHFLPNAVLLVHPFGTEGRAVEEVAPFVTGLGPIDGHAAAYVCRDRACRRPVTKPQELREILLSIGPKH
jgi:uncharacterized protein YyaL (SSP411 family)